MKHYWTRVHYTDGSDPTLVIVCSPAKDDALTLAKGVIHEDRQHLVDLNTTEFDHILTCTCKTS